VKQVTGGSGRLVTGGSGKLVTGGSGKQVTADRRLLFDGGMPVTHPLKNAPHRPQSSDLCGMTGKWGEEPPVIVFN